MDLESMRQSSKDEFNYGMMCPALMAPSAKHAADEGDVLLSVLCSQAFNPDILLRLSTSAEVSRSPYRISVGGDHYLPGMFGVIATMLVDLFVTGDRNYGSGDLRLGILQLRSTMLSRCSGMDSATLGHGFVTTRYINCVDMILQFMINVIRKLSDGGAGGCNGHSVAGCIFTEAATFRLAPDRYAVKINSDSDPVFKGMSDSDTRYFDNVDKLNSPEAKQMLYRLLLDTDDPANNTVSVRDPLSPAENIPGRSPAMIISVMTGMLHCLLFGNSEDSDGTLPPNVLTWYLLRPDCYSTCHHKVCEASCRSLTGDFVTAFNPSEVSPYLLGIMCGSPYILKNDLGGNIK